MDEAFVQNPKNDIDRQQRRRDQNGLGAQRLLVGQQRPGKKSLHGGRSAKTFLHLADAQSRITQRYVRSEVKRYRNRGE